MLAYPTIVVPGITASNLRDMYPLPSVNVWTTFKKKYDRVLLHPDDLRYEYKQPSLVRPDQIYRVVYQELVEDLRDELSDMVNKEVPVYPFAYDWRKPLNETQQLLRNFIDEVIERTLLLPHYRKRFKLGDGMKVNLVGHSMGGLVIARCLTDQRDNPPPVNRVSTLATPFQGSFEAIVKLVIGTGKLGGGRPSHAERRAARVTPALYQLLPTFPVNEMFENGIDADFLNVDAWQPSILGYLSKTIKETGLHDNSKDFESAAKQLFEGFLSQARTNKEIIENLNLADHGLENKWLAIVGVDSETRVKVSVKYVKNRPQYVFDHSHVRNDWDMNTPSSLKYTGDGVVPFQGARPPFLKDSNLVLVRPGDYASWEVKDNILSSISYLSPDITFHGLLPNMNLVQRILLRFLKEGDSRDRYGNTWGRKVPGVDKWEPPLELEEGSKNQ